MTGFDDELRNALGAGAGTGPGGSAPPPPPFDDVCRRARAQQRRRRALAGSGLAVVVIGLGGLAWALASTDEPESSVIVDSPETSSTRPPSPTTTNPPGMTAGTYSTTTTVPGLAIPEPGPRPDELVAVDEHGRLIVVDAASGDVIRELDADGDPTEPVPPEAEIGPNILDDVALAPDGVVYYTSVGEPAAGSIYRRLIDGTPPPDDVAWAFGNDIAVRADGAEVATGGSTGDGFIIPADGAGIADGASPRPLIGDDVPNDVYIGSVSWSLDGATVAAEWSPFADGRSQPNRLALIPLGSGAEVVVTADGGRSFTDPAFRRDGAVAVAEQDACEDFGGGCGNALGRVLHPVTGELMATFDYGTNSAVVDQSYDATGTWLLVTFDDGTMRWYGGGQSGTVPGRYRAGDW